MRVIFVADGKDVAKYVHEAPCICSLAMLKSLKECRVLEVRGDYWKSFDWKDVSEYCAVHNIRQVAAPVAVFTSDLRNTHDLARRLHLLFYKHVLNAQDIKGRNEVIIGMTAKYHIKADEIFNEIDMISVKASFHKYFDNHEYT